MHNIQLLHEELGDNDFYGPRWRSPGPCSGGGGRLVEPYRGPLPLLGATP